MQPGLHTERLHLNTGVSLKEHSSLRWLSSSGDGGQGNGRGRRVIGCLSLLPRATNRHSSSEMVDIHSAAIGSLPDM